MKTDESEFVLRCSECGKVVPSEETLLDVSPCWNLQPIADKRRFHRVGDRLCGPVPVVRKEGDV